MKTTSNTKNNISDEIIKQAREKLWRQGQLQWKLSPTQKKIYDFFTKNSEKITTLICSRRGGKCLKEGTEVMTPLGPVQIQDLKIGDKVYGYNLDGTISLTNVVGVEFQGEKDVVDLLNNDRVIASSTLDHRWLMYNTYHETKTETSLTNAKLYRDKIVRKFIQIPGGDIDYPKAYVLGALLGDGCSMQNSDRTRQIFISSEDDLIPKKVCTLLNVQLRKNRGGNFTWAMSSSFGGKGIAGDKIDFSLYESWCKGRYAHEKLIDIEVVKTWNRKSQLALLAGLLDTDGSVYLTKKDNSLEISFCSQSNSLIQGFKYLIKSLFQYDVSIRTDKRPKYANGPCYTARIKNNLFGKKILKELDEHLVLERKKWKPEYEALLENNTNPDHVGVTLSAPYKARTWDIEVDNDSHLYLLANGLVTHNSFVLTVLALEQCIKKANSIVKFIQPEQKMIRMNIKPLMQEITKDCPKDMMPKFSGLDNKYTFPNGSEIHLAGTDNGNADKLRGSNSDLCLVDEAGFCTDLGYIINSVLTPLTLLTRGKIILSTTVPPDPNHEFIKNYMLKAKPGALLIKTIYDFRDDDLTSPNPRITDEVITEILKVYPEGAKSDAFRNEFLCKIISDSASSVIPEFNEETEKFIVRPFDQPGDFPTHYHRYEAMDIGIRDLTVVLYAFYNFDLAKLYILDEIVMNGTTMITDRLAKEIKEKEQLYWFNEFEGIPHKIHKRVADNNNLLLLNDLNIKHGLNFYGTRKDNKEAAINALRIAIQGEEIVIHPRCVTLINHLQSSMWNKTKTDFERGMDGSHADALMALVYLYRNVDKNISPYPYGFRRNQALPGVPEGDRFYSPNEKKDPKSYDNFKKMFVTRNPRNKNR